jgi:hypothetical protein
MTGDEIIKRERLRRAHQWLQHALVRNFNGYTAYEAQGAWDNGRRIVREPVMIYDIAIDPLPVNCCALSDIVRHLADTSGEEAIYLRWHDGRVLFETPTPKEN